MTIVWAWALRRWRRLDLGASERLSAALTFGWAALIIGVPAPLIHIAPAAHVLPVVAVMAAFATCSACLTHDPTFVARAQRVLVAVTLLGGPTSLFAASMASEVPREAGLITLLGSLAGVVAGLAGVPVARPLAPEQSRWLGAIEQARAARDARIPKRPLPARYRRSGRRSARRRAPPSSGASIPPPWRPSIAPGIRRSIRHRDP